METNIEEVSQIKKRIGVEIEAEEVTKKLDEAYKKLSKKVKVRGFRPGKIPRKILEQYYGKDILADVKSTLIEESFTNVIQETKLFPLGQPSIEDEAIRPGENFKYTIEMEVKPEFELKDYMGFSVEKEILNISKKDVDTRLEQIKEARANLVSINEDRNIQEGDYTIIDYEGFWNGKPLKQISGKDFAVDVGSKRFYPEVESALVGLKKDEQKDILIDIKDDFPDKRLAGKQVSFRVRIQDIKKKELPELNDEFAKSLGDEFTSLAELKKRIKKDITLQEEKRIDGELKGRLLKKIASSVNFELPETMVENETQRQVAMIKQNLLLSGTRFESTGLSEEKMRQDLRGTAEEKIKEDFVLAKIADLEDIKIDDSDLRNGFQELAAQTGKDVATLERYHEQNNLLDSFRNQLLSEKILNHISQGANIIETKGLSKQSPSARKEAKTDANTDSR